MAAKERHVTETVEDGTRTTSADTHSARRLLSVVVPVFNEEENVGPLHLRLREAMDALSADYEIIYIDDGSTDASFDRLRDLSGDDPQIHVLRFRRNFGQTAALQAGIENSRGDVLVFLDADLQ
jgi:glycosyltransferase involved in cell wall biosynthesis